MVFFPDNVKRADRLQQLVDSTANMQTDIKHASDSFVDFQEKLKSTVDDLLKKGGYNNFDDLYKKAMEKMSEDDRKKFEALIASARSFQENIDIGYYITGLLMLPEGGVITGVLALRVGRFIVKLSVIQRFAQFIRATATGAKAASEAASAISKAAAESEKALSEAGLAGEAGAEISQAAKWMGRVSKVFKFLGAVGFVLTILVAALDYGEAKEQKQNLIEAIHNVQPSRLTVKYYKRQAENINQKLELFKLYFTEMNKDTPNQTLLDAYKTAIYDGLKELDDAIDWDKLEDELETQDKTSSNFYSGDDLSRDEVIKLAKNEA